MLVMDTGVQISSGAPLLICNVLKASEILRMRTTRARSLRVKMTPLWRAQTRSSAKPSLTIASSRKSEAEAWVSLTKRKTPSLVALSLSSSCPKTMRKMRKPWRGCVAKLALLQP